MIGNYIYIAVTVVICVVALIILVKAMKVIFKGKTIEDKKLEVTYRPKVEAASSDVSGEYKVVNGFEVRLNQTAQDNFMPGRNGYEMARNDGNLRSVIFRDATGLQKLLDEKAGTGEFITANKERIDFNVPIGQYVDPVTKGKVETSVGVIHYTPEGAYIVPARPSNREVR